MVDKRNGRAPIKRHLCRHTNKTTTKTKSNEWLALWHQAKECNSLNGSEAKHETINLIHFSSSNIGNGGSCVNIQTKAHCTDNNRNLPNKFGQWRGDVQVKEYKKLSIIIINIATITLTVTSITTDAGTKSDADTSAGTKQNNQIKWKAIAV